MRSKEVKRRTYRHRAAAVAAREAPHGPPDPHSEKAPGQGRPISQKLEQQERGYLASFETQACFFVLLPIVVMVVLLALAGAHQ
jgi:hypothetical protein